MPRKRVSMRKTREVLRLYFDLKLVRIPDDADQRSGMKPITIPF